MRPWLQSLVVSCPQAECATCATKITGRSSSTHVRNSSLITKTACSLLREGGPDGADECVVTITLESLSQVWPTFPVIVKVSEVEPVAMQGGNEISTLSIVPELLRFDPTDGASSQKLIIKVRSTQHDDPAYS